MIYQQHGRYGQTTAGFVKCDPTDILDQKAALCLVEYIAAFFGINNQKCLQSRLSAGTESFMVENHQMGVTSVF